MFLFGTCWFKLFLVLELGDEFQIGSGQIFLDPGVDFAIQFRAEVILPVASLSFANERVALVGESGLDFHVHVDRLVLGEFFDFDVIDQLFNLLVGQRLVQKGGDPSNFLSDILFFMENLNMNLVV